MRVRLLETNGRVVSRKNVSLAARRARRHAFLGESLEQRLVLSAALAPIPTLSVPALQGYTELLDGSATTDPQTFSAASSNPEIAVTIPSTTYWNVGVSYTDPSDSNNDFSGTLTFALFGNLTPKTVQMITEFTNDSYYVNSGNQIWRVASNFDGTTTTVIEGGATSAQAQGSTAPSGQPGTPFANENVQSLAPTGIDQLFMANAGGTDSNDTQFFIDTGPLDSQLGYQYTLFGQLVSGAGVLAKIASVPVTRNFVGETSEPVNPITITATSLTTANSSGLLVIDTTQAHPGETATITVTAHDGTSQTQQSFPVSVGQYAGSTAASFLATVNFKPYANSVSYSVSSPYQPTILQLEGLATFPVEPATVSSYTILSPPSHGTISEFDLATGSLVYTPTPGYVGADSFTYDATADGPNTSEPAATSNPATIYITVQGGHVYLGDVIVVRNSKDKVTELVLNWFGGPLEASIAGTKSPYELLTSNRKGSFTGRGVGMIAIKKVVYDNNEWSVTLRPKTPFSMTKNVELLVHGNGKRGLKDSLGYYIAGSVKNYVPGVGYTSGTNAVWDV